MGEGYQRSPAERDNGAVIRRSVVAWLLEGKEFPSVFTWDFVVLAAGGKQKKVPKLSKVWAVHPNGQYGVQE